MNFKIFKEVEKETLFEEIKSYLISEDLIVVNQDKTRPWGGFFVIDEMQSQSFVSKFFPQLKISEIQIGNKLSPKILIVAPNKRLSWQYHFRRSEIWTILSGPVGVQTSLTDEIGELRNLIQGTVIQMDKGERHRLIGLENWGIVAEIWQHTDNENPSNEDDIVRLQDDFGR